MRSKVVRKDLRDWAGWEVGCQFGFHFFLKGVAGEVRTILVVLGLLLVVLATQLGPFRKVVLG